MYAIEIKKSARREIDALPSKVRDRIRISIAALAQDPRPTGCKKLVGTTYWRIRVGDYRIVYDVKDKQLLVLVLQVGDRKDIYR